MVTGSRPGPLAELADRRHGFAVYILAGTDPPRSRAEARERGILRLTVARGLDCNGQREFHLYGPVGQRVPMPHLLLFLPGRPPKFAHFRLATCPSPDGHVWSDPGPLLWTNS